VLQGGWHEEVSAERRVGENGKLRSRDFMKDSHHTAVFGRGSDLPVQEYSKTCSQARLLMMAAPRAVGAASAYREKLNDDVEVTALYAWQCACTRRKQRWSSERFVAGWPHGTASVLTCRQNCLVRADTSQ